MLPTMERKGMFALLKNVNMTVLKHVQRSKASLRLNKKPDSDSLPGFFISLI
jgi:hypothetical protein